MKTHTRNEADILHKALEAFERGTGFKTKYSEEHQVVLSPYHKGILQIGESNSTQVLNVEIKLTMNEFVLGKLVAQNRLNPESNILVTRYMPPYLAKRMKDLHLQFIDTAGNAYVNRPPLLIFMYGNKVAHVQDEDTTGNLFGSAGIRVVFALLCKQNMEQSTYRDIAAAAGVALGTVAGVMKDLAQQRYLLELADRGRILVKKEDLADKWIDAYISRFRGRRLIGRYAAHREHFWRDSDLGPLTAKWGGEVAAQKLTHYLKPEIITIYTHVPVDGLVMNLKLRKDDKGPIELREQFWDFDFETENKHTVPPLLVYADLMAVGDTRTLETAEMVHEEFLKKYFQ